jgi:hypothetical protein
MFDTVFEMNFANALSFEEACAKRQEMVDATAGELR